MPTLTIMRGLPASGKTTEARKLVEKGAVRVNKDDLRAMLHNEWSKSNEKDTLKARDMIIRGLISAGKDIVVDDTNFEPKHIETIREIVDAWNELLEEKQQYKIVIRDIDTPLEECLKRDANRTGKAHVGKKVILSMYNKYLAKKQPLKPLQEGLKSAIMVDIDGTLAEKGDRDIYDGSKVYLDTVIQPVADVVQRFRRDVVIIMSGRDEEYREVTEQWLEDNGIEYECLYMRPRGDRRADWIVKKELYDAHVNGKYNVRFVLDDRKQVKRMWVGEGLFVLDVNQTDAEF